MSPFADFSVCWLVQGGDTLPSVRFRVVSLCALAPQHGVAAERLRYPKTLAGRLACLFRLFCRRRRPDALILQKRLLSGPELVLLRRLGRRLVYDFDDAVWTEQAAPERAEAGRHRARFRRMCAHADLVIAANRTLAAAVPPETPVLILPTPIDTSVYTPGQGEDGLRRRDLVGWMGTSSYLAEAREPLREVARATGRPVCVVSDAPPGWGTPADVAFRVWSPETELDSLRSFAVGLMPLPDTAYTQGKGGFKLLQYMACGAVPVASAVGFNREIIRHGENGFLVENLAGWSAYVARLLADAPLRLRLAAAARETVCRHFDCRDAAGTLFRALRNLRRIDNASDCL